jgi:predicted thioredoxin/glutaredoxin
MGIMDEFETGPVDGLRPIAMRDEHALRLTPNDLVILATWVSSPAYVVWQKLSEGVIEKLETSHFQNWKVEADFQRTGLVAVSARLHYEQVQLEAKRAVEEFSGELDFARIKKEQMKVSPEQQIMSEFK